MAYIKLNRKKLEHNYRFLDELFKANDIEWAVVSKLLCGHKPYIKELIDLGATEICDSRISNLAAVKELNPEVQTVYIKPPAAKNVDDVVRYADTSFNTEIDTIRLLSEEATKQGKVHKVLIMIELGDLREGVMGEELLHFYSEVFRLPGISVRGIGANLNCLYGVMPSQDKLIQLSLYEQLIEAKFDRPIPYVSGGTSVVIPLLFNHQVPRGINHFRVGEMLYFGNNLFTDEPVEELRQDVIKLYAQIIELTEKPKVPTGVMAANPSGEEFEVNEDDYGKTSYRAILDLGLLDVQPEYLMPEDHTLEVTGASSDMLVLDLGENQKNYKVGDIIPFNLKYMGALGLLNSDYIEKLIED
jgi:predicted amino acid racemase